MPRKPKHDDLSHLDLKKRAALIGRKEKIHQRMERELTNLKRDRRFWEGDKGYRAYVQRQFDRVYNDPTGKPQPLRIGAPKIFATEIEPFTPSTKNRGKRTTTGSDGALTRLLQVGTNDLNRQGLVADPGDLPPIDGVPNAPEGTGSTFESTEREFKRTGNVSTDDLWDKFLGLLDVHFTDREDPVKSGRAKAQETLKQFRRLNWPTAEMLLDHYLGGSGEDVTVPADFVQDYPTLDEGYEGVFRNFSRWFVGDLVDTRIGVAPLPLREGTQTTIGAQHGRRDVPLENFVMWESTFTGAGETFGPIDKLALDDEVHASIGGGTLQGFASSLTLVREGDVVRISGLMQFRIEDKYAFGDSHWLDFDQLQKAGLAENFWVRSEPWLREVEGMIFLENDRPVEAKIWVTDNPNLKGQFSE